VGQTDFVSFHETAERATGATTPNFGDGLIDTVNARDLHKALEVKTAFKDWVTRRIEDCRFQGGSDFCSFLSESTGGRPSKEYFLSLDVAKHFAMLERNEQGFQVRQYFVVFEKGAKMAVSSIQEAGLYFNFRLPLDGEFKVGANWAETH